MLLDANGPRPRSGRIHGAELTGTATVAAAADGAACGAGALIQQQTDSTGSPRGADAEAARAGWNGDIVKQVAGARGKSRNRLPKRHRGNGGIDL